MSESADRFKSIALQAFLLDLPFSIDRDDRVVTLYFRCEGGATDIDAVLAFAKEQEFSIAIESSGLSLRGSLPAE